MGRVKITLTKSPIGYAKDQRATVEAIGLRRLGHTVEKESSPSLDGQIAKVRHLLTVEALD